MQRYYVGSKEIRTIGYREGVLEVELKDREIRYQYWYVIEQVFKNFCRAAAKEEFYYKEIKGVYPEEEVA